MSGSQVQRSTPAKLRTGRASDVEALEALERAIFKSRQFAGHLISRASFWRFLDSPSARLIVAEVGTELSGYVLILYRSNSNFARMYSVGVATHFRKRGLARLLLAAAEKDAISRDRKEMRLEARANDPGALALYESSGYRCFGRRRGYYGGRVDALRFHKPLIGERRRRS